MSLDTDTPAGTEFQTGTPFPTGLKDLIDDEPHDEKPSAAMYDRDAQQTIPLVIKRGEKVSQAGIKLSPISDKEYFALMKALANNAKRVKTVSVELFAPYAEIGKKLAVERIGWKPNPNWRETTLLQDYISAVRGYLTVVVDRTEVKAGDDDLLDDEEETFIPLISNFGDQEVKTGVYFKPESQDDLDEYLRAQNGEPRKNALASAAEESKEERLFALYKKLAVRDENYSSGVPAWHAVEAVAGFLNGQLTRLGKL